MNILKGLIPEIKSALPEILKLRAKKTKKDDDSFVSEGDLLVDRIVIEFVKKNYPSVTLITEETYTASTIDLHATEYIAIVDPIDGTENFISGLLEWGVGVCIYHNGIFEEALIGLPELDQYVHSEDEIEKVLDSRIYGISSSLTKEDLLALESGFEYRIIGCCMYNMYNVIRGSFKQFQNPKGAKCWDILPGLNIALKHGLEVIVDNKPYHGEFLQATERYRFCIKNL